MAFQKINLKEGDPTKSVVMTNFDDVQNTMIKLALLSDEKVGEALLDIGGTTATRIQDRTPVREGSLKADIFPDPVAGQSVVVRTHGIGYAEAVEFGVKGREYTYNIEGIGDLTSVGAGMFRRTADDLSFRKEIIDIASFALKI